ncbi:MAG TPA: hypothetical protein VFR78_13490 [Pyrinomonadaceae bacterium]|nr:hypothetical protein [Pyrinomonadaceae bacterium]
MALRVQRIIDEMDQLSEDDQRALAGAILNDGKLEALVEEVEDHLSCEAATEESPVKFSLRSRR